MFFITDLNLQSFNEVQHLFTFPHMAVTGHLSNSEGHQEASLNGVNFGKFTMESSPRHANEEARSQLYFRIDKTLRCWLVFTNLLISDQERRQSINVLIFMMRNMIVEWDGTCPVSPHGNRLHRRRQIIRKAWGMPNQDRALASASSVHRSRHTCPVFRSLLTGHTSPDTTSLGSDNYTSDFPQHTLSSDILFQVCVGQEAFTLIKVTVHISGLIH